MYVLAHEDTRIRIIGFLLLPGIKISEINRAEGERQAAILRSEAQREEKINVAKGEANAILAKAEARAKSLEVLSKAIGQKVLMSVSTVVWH